MPRWLERGWGWISLPLKEQRFQVFCSKVFILKLLFVAIYPKEHTHAITDGQLITVINTPANVHVKVYTATEIVSDRSTNLTLTFRNVIDSVKT